MSGSLLRNALFVCLSLLLFAKSAIAQNSLALSSNVGSPYFTTNLTLTLTAPPSNAPAALQWTLTYPAGSVTDITVSSNIPTKAAVCTVGVGSTTCVFSGANNDPIQ